MRLILEASRLPEASPGRLSRRTLKPVRIWARMAGTILLLPENDAGLPRPDPVEGFDDLRLDLIMTVHKFGGKGVGRSLGAHPGQDFGDRPADGDVLAWDLPDSAPGRPRILPP